MPISKTCFTVRVFGDSFKIKMSAQKCPLFGRFLFLILILDSVWRPTIGATIEVSDFVVRNTTTDSTQDIRNAIDAAGREGVLNFPNAATLIVSGTLRPYANQVWNMNGCTLKRRTAIASITDSHIVPGLDQQIISVFDASSFRVGMDVTIVSGDLFDPQNHRIIGITGNDLLLGTAFSQEFVQGGVVVTSFTMVASTALGVFIRDGLFDGNQSENQFFQRWENQADLFITDGNTVTNCLFQNAQAEAIEVGGEGATVIGNRIQFSQGNGIHLTGTRNCRIESNKIEHTNLGGPQIGHSDGCITFSNSTTNSIIINNILTDGLAALGSFDSVDNSGFVFQGNVCSNMRSYAFEGLLPTGEQVGGITIVSNIFNDCHVGLLEQIVPIDDRPALHDIVVAQNQFSGTILRIRNAIRCDVISNAFNFASSPDSSAAVVVNIEDSSQINVLGNFLSGGLYGFYVTGAKTRDINISRNTLENQFNGAIRLQPPLMQNVVVCTNTVISSVASAPTYIAITVPDGASALNNIVIARAGSVGILATGVGNETHATISNNLVLGSSLSASILTYGGSSNQVITRNLVEKSISDGGSPQNYTLGNREIFEYLRPQNGKLLAQKWNDSVILLMQADPGISFFVESSVDFTTWTPVFSETSDSLGLIFHLDDIVRPETSIVANFYRVSMN